jgi:hypothetical protein
MLQHIQNLRKQKQHLHIVIAYAAFYEHAKYGICPDHMWSLHIFWQTLNLQIYLWQSHINYGIYNMTKDC